MRALSSRLFCPCNDRRVSLEYLSAGCRYTAGHMAFTIPRLTPGGLLSVRLSPASPGAFPQIAIRLVALLRPPPDSGASPCTRFSRAPRWGVTPTSTPADPPPRIRRVLVPTCRFSLTGRFPFRVLFRLGLRRVQPGSPLTYSPLSFASRARFPVSPTMDSATWSRWWFAAHPNRSLRLPAWEEVSPGALLSTFQHAHVIHAVGSLLCIPEVGQAAVLSGVVGQGVLFPKDETHFRCIHHATS